MRDDSEIEGDVRADAPSGGVRAPATDAPAIDVTASSATPGGATTGSGATMTITFKLYATLQDLLPAGAVKNAVPVEVATDATLNEIIDRYRVPRELAHLVLVNGVFAGGADRDERGRLKPNDVLAIWPPVAGG